MKTISVQKLRGFTVLELMVTLTVVAVLVTVGVPGFQTIIASQRSSASVNDLIEGLILARSEAIKRGRYISVCKSTDGASCAGDGAAWSDGWIIFVNASAAFPATVDPGDEILRIHQALPTPLSINASGNIDAFISFRPTGTTGTNALNFSGTLTLCEVHGNTGPRGLIVAPSGRLQVSREQDHTGAALACA